MVSNEVKKYIRILSKASVKYIYFVFILAAMAVFFVPNLTSATGYITTLNDRYVMDANGNAKFLLGYYKWNPPNMYDYGSNPSPYNLKDTLDRAATSGANYIRVSKFNTGSGSTGHENPFLYSGGKTNLKQWDSTFWTNLKASIAYAATKGVLVHYTIFNGVHYRVQSGSIYGWKGSFWNPANHSTTFYATPDLNSNGTTDENNEFYNTSAFNAGTGIGYYQKLYIDKMTTELESYPNVFYEVGNETMRAPDSWLAAVRAYVATKTNKLVTVNRCTGFLACTVMSTDPGMWKEHGSTNGVAGIKSRLETLVGKGYPVMSDEVQAFGGDRGEPSATEARQLAWYSLTTGAAGWGGWSMDFWTALNTDKMAYYKHLQNFLSTTGIKFWNMTPQHTLVSNRLANSLLAKTGTEYLAYILSDTSATINLSAAAGNFTVQFYNPKTGAYSSGPTVSGGASRTFYKPTGASDWVIYLKASGTNSNTPPSASITTPSSDGTSVAKGSALNFSGTISDSDSSSLNYGWYIDRIGDSLLEALIKQGTQAPGNTSGSINMTGTKTNIANPSQAISLDTVGATYNLILKVSDGVNTEVQTIRSFILTNSAPAQFCGDRSCNNGETCSTCSEDCGACETTNQPPALSITDPSTDGGSVKTGSSLNFSGNVSDTDSSSIKVSWYIDRMGDGLEKALIKEGNQAPGTSSGSLTMTGTKTTTTGQTISLTDIGATYDLVLAASDGSNPDVEIRRSFTLSGYNLASFTQLVADWLKSMTGSPADVNLDNKVNSRDMGIMMSNWQ